MPVLRNTVPQRNGKGEKKHPKPNTKKTNTPRKPKKKRKKKKKKNTPPKKKSWTQESEKFPRKEGKGAGIRLGKECSKRLQGKDINWETNLEKKAVSEPR